jgi:hypothetical protein
MYFLYLIRTALGNYIGVSKNTQRRFGRHRHSRFPVGDAVRHDLACTVQTLCAGNREYIYQLEPLAITRFETRWPNGFNLAAGGHGGRQHLPQTKSKIAKTKIGRSRSPETCAKISAAKKGLPLHPAFLAASLAANTGRRPSPATINAMRVANTGRSRSPETRAKISAATKGKKRGPLSTEHIANLKLARANRAPTSAETRAKISAAQLGKTRGPQSIEHRTRLSVSLTRAIKEKQDNGIAWGRGYRT